jgi:NAD(P)-dependent dehydrogenase (short-subunit alcohol dehydrogenase family)
VEPTRYERALIVGAGQGLSASLARLLSREGMRLALASRNPDRLAALCKETGARAFSCDSTDATQVRQLFADVEKVIGEPDVVVYNASGRVRGPLVDLDPAEVARTLAISAFGGFLVAQQAARRMLAKKRGAILFTGADCG